ncbi:hypothetical protein L1286_14200 [Pseudoalteromonas sp. SMS1]|uniref:hypothetical protein n=1 Tax=Pseudoalteromonas sp. SMS1 TaxID=2908894 RepID=UPI001F3E7069|nr:hypothetical protein [Pseudoalteromonas sp. SMS1]MCF2858634.1 hypothetical protein [Pseudoalteromonas sp. SMS1]
MRWFSTIFMICLLTACGGGGSIERDSSGDGDTDTAEYSLVLSLNSQSGSSELSVANPIQVQATVTKDGQPLSDRLVRFIGDEFSDFNGAESALTNSQGVAVVGIVANENEGAGTIQASFEANNETITKGIEYAAAGDGGIQIALSMKDAEGKDINAQNPLQGQFPATVMATLTDNAQPITDKIITFTFDELLSTTSNGKIVTNASGQASFKVNATQLTGAGTIVAQYEETSNSIAYVSDGYEFFGIEKYELELRGIDQQSAIADELSFASPLTIQAIATLNGNPISDQSIAFTVNDRALISSNLAQTNANGIATVVLTENNIASQGDNKDGLVTASFTPDESDIVQRSFAFSSKGDGGLQMTVTITDADGNAINLENPLGKTTSGRISVSLSDNGVPVTGAIVSAQLDDRYSNAVTIPANGLAETQANGVATVQLIANTENGVGEIVASYTRAETNETVSERKTFHSAGNEDFGNSSYQFNVVGKKNDGSGDESMELSASTPLILEAQLALNNIPLSGERVTFEVDDFGVLSPSSGSVLTNANGVASIILRDNSKDGAGQVKATYVLGDGTPLERDFNFNSAGDGGIQLAIQHIRDGSGADIGPKNKIGEDNNGTVTIKLTEDGENIVGGLVTFQTDSQNVATLLPTNGRAETDENGIATIELVATSESSGVGFVTANYQNESVTKNFHSAGVAEAATGIYSIDIRVLTNCATNFDEDRNSVELDPGANGCQSVNSISSLDNNIFVYVRVSTAANTDIEVPNQIITVSTDKGAILPSSGKVLTDSFGVALLQLQPGDGGGAGTITALYKGEDGTQNFEVNTGELYLGLTSPLEVPTTPDVGNVNSLPELDSGDSFILTATLYTDEERTNVYDDQQVDLEFTSTCVAEGGTPPLATIDASVSTKQGVANSTYRTSGCAGVESITASIGSGAIVTYDFYIKEAPVQAIQFNLNSDGFNGFIGLPPGIGGVNTTSSVQFTLFDTDNRPMQQKYIEFRLADLTGKASLTNYRGNTDNDGIAKTTVTAGVVPGDIVVEACYIPDEELSALADGQVATCWQSKIDQCVADRTLDFCPSDPNNFVLIDADKVVNAVSSGIVLSSGVPDQDSFDAAPDVAVLNALNYVDVTTNITVFFGDQFNQLTADSLVANIQAEAGVIGSIDGTGGNSTYTCTAVDGKCTVQWRKQGDFPLNDEKWQNNLETVCGTYLGRAGPCVDTFPANVVRGGRVTILATAKGQENFHDKPGVGNRNGVFDSGEFYALNDDLAEAFIDFNENNQYDGVNCNINNNCEPGTSTGGHNEVFLDANNNGLLDNGNGIYNGLLCIEDEDPNNPGVKICSRDLVDIRKQFEIVMSSDEVMYRYVINRSQLDNAACTLGTYEGVGGLATNDSSDYCDISSIDQTDANVNDSHTIRLYYSDIFGNTLPVGTRITVGTENGTATVISGDGEIVARTNTGIQFVEIRIGQEITANSAEQGNLVVTFTIPGPNQGADDKVVQAKLPIFDAG